MECDKHESKSLPADGLIENEIGEENKGESSPVKESVVESVQLPDSDGFALDFIQKNRTGDNIRRNFLSKLTY